jgi:hypothetical protein
MINQIKIINPFELEGFKIVYSKFNDDKKSEWDERLESLIFHEMSYQVGDKSINGYIVKAKQESNRVIIFNRGGSKDFGAIDDKQLVFRIGLYASWGYTVITSQLSGNAGSDGIDEYGGSDIFDIIELKNIAQEFLKREELQFYMIGESRGV